MKFQPVAMDMDKEEVVVFEIRKKPVSMYIWVRPGEGVPDDWKIRVKDALEFCQYGKWVDEPMDVSGDFPRDMIEYAIETIEKDGRRELVGAIDEFERKLQEMSEDEINDVKAVEKDIRKSIRVVQNDYHGENQYNGKLVTW